MKSNHNTNSAYGFYPIKVALNWLKQLGTMPEFRKMKINF